MSVSIAKKDPRRAESGRTMYGREKLRVGVIGTGAFAQACHIPELRGHPDVELVALCGRDIAHTRALAGRFGIAVAVTDAESLCARDDIDAITICSPNAAHCEQAVLACNDKPVFCEKPLAPGLGEARVMADSARTSRRVSQVALTFRHLYGVQELRRRIGLGQIGEPLFLRARHEYADWLVASAPSGWRHGSAVQGGGVLLDSGAHLMDLARFLLAPSLRPCRPEVARPAGRRLRRHRDGVVPLHLRRDRTMVRQQDRTVAVPQLHRGRGPRGDARGRDLARRLRYAAPPASRRRDMGGDRSPRRSGQRPAACARPHERSFVDGCLRGELADGAASFEDGFAVQRILAAAAKAAAGSSSMPLEPVA